MDRIKLKCLIAGKEVELQLDKGDAGRNRLIFIITEDGGFKGYIIRKNDSFHSLGASNYPDNDLKIIWEYISDQIGL